MTSNLAPGVVPAGAAVDQVLGVVGAIPSIRPRTPRARIATATKPGALGAVRSRSCSFGM